MAENEPEDIHFACIGCGSMNPSRAEVCSGCGHRFDGQEGAEIRDPVVDLATKVGEIRHPRDPHLPPMQPSGAGCVARVIVGILTAIASIVAFGVAFFTTCLSVPDNGTAIPWSLFAGLVAAVAVIALGVWIASMFGSRRDRFEKSQVSGEE